MNANDKEVLESYRKGAVTKIMKSATPNAVLQLIDWIDDQTTEIDRLRRELRQARNRLKPYVIADTFDGDLPSDPGTCWEATTDRLCGPEKGGAG